MNPLKIAAGMSYKQAKYGALFLTMLFAGLLVYNFIRAQSTVQTAASLLLAALAFILYIILNKAENLQNNLVENQEKITQLEKNLDEELNKARDVHQKILPDKLPEAEDLTISSFYQPAEYMGGDYYNIFQIDHGSMSSILDQYLVYYFDVSGHGIDSTLLSIFVNDAVENYFKLKHSPGEKVEPAEIMNFVDRQYQNENFPHDYLVCLFLGLLDLNNYRLSYAAGGLQFPLYLIDRKKGLQKIETGGLPLSTGLGAREDRPSGSLELPQNNTLFLSTDGLFEQRKCSQDNSIMYHSRAEEVLEASRNLPTPFIKDIMSADFNRFTAGDRGDDDVTFMLIERLQGEIDAWQVTGKVQIEDNISKIVTQLTGAGGEYVDDVTLKILQNILRDIFQLCEQQINPAQISCKINDQEQYITLTMETNPGQSSWKNIMNNYKEKDNISKITCPENTSPDRDKLYFSYNEFYNKLHLLVFK